MCKNTRRGQYCARKWSQKLSKSCQGKPNKSLLLFLAHRAFYRCKLNIWKTLISVFSSHIFLDIAIKEVSTQSALWGKTLRYCDKNGIYTNCSLRYKERIIINIIVSFFNYIEFCLRRNLESAKIKNSSLCQKYFTFSLKYTLYFKVVYKQYVQRRFCTLNN